MPGCTVKDVDPNEFVDALAAFYKKSGKLKVPEWVDVVKTGKHKELGPIDPDWYYTRAAAISRHLYVRGGVGVGAMTKIFGGRRRRGTKPNHACRGSSSVARKVLQSLEGIKIIERGTHGRRITSQGQRDLDRIAAQVKAGTEGKPPAAAAAPPAAAKN